MQISLIFCLTDSSKNTGHSEFSRAEIIRSLSYLITNMIIFKKIQNTKTNDIYWKFFRIKNIGAKKGKNIDRYPWKPAAPTKMDEDIIKPNLNKSVNSVLIDM